MWFSRLLLLAALGLAGCGFTPAYAPNAPANALLGRVAVEAPDDRLSFQLVRRLEERLGRGETADYGLSVVIETETEGLGITEDQEITRFNLLGEAGFALRDLATGEVLTDGVVTAFAAYSATGTTVSARIAERDAGDRLMQILADEIITRLIATAPDWNAPPGVVARLSGVTW